MRTSRVAEVKGCPKCLNTGQPVQRAEGMRGRLFPATLRTRARVPNLLALRFGSSFHLLCEYSSPRRRTFLPRNQVLSLSVHLAGKTRLDSTDAVPLVEEPYRSHVPKVIRHLRTTQQLLKTYADL